MSFFLERSAQKHREHVRLVDLEDWLTQKKIFALFTFLVEEAIFSQIVHIGLHCEIFELESASSFA